DQLLVGVSKLVVIVAAATVTPTPAWMRTGATSLAVAVAALAVLVLATAWAPDRVLGPLGRALPRRRAALARAGDALAPFRSARRAAPAAAMAMLKVAAQVVAAWCLQRAFDLDVPVASAVVVVAALSLSTMVPLVPGSLGVFEGTIVLAYEQF